MTDVASTPSEDAAYAQRLAVRAAALQAEFDAAGMGRPPVRILAPGRPAIIALIGSTRWHLPLMNAARDLSLLGYIVLAPGVFEHAGHAVTDEQKARLEEVATAKIDLADLVHVVCPGGYVGDSTTAEIRHAESTGKRLTFSEPPDLTTADLVHLGYPEARS